MQRKGGMTNRRKEGRAAGAACDARREGLVRAGGVIDRRATCQQGGRSRWGKGERWSAGCPPAGGPPLPTPRVERRGQRGMGMVAAPVAVAAVPRAVRRGSAKDESAADLTARASEGGPLG